jgi:DNA-binding MurR/RpiR family transcriptional regulator
MTTLRQLSEEKERYYAHVAAYVFANPTEPFREVAGRFALSQSTVSRIAKRSGLAGRRPGRKPRRSKQLKCAGGAQ